MQKKDLQLGMREKSRYSPVKSCCLPVLLLTLVLLTGQASWTEPAATGHQSLPQGFRGFTIGMTVEQVKLKLAEDPYFDYRGDPDVSFLPQTSQYLIECQGNSFIERAYFQFHEEKLYILTLVLNTDKLDHYSLFTTLSAKYGNFTALSPEKITWESAELQLILEKPLSIKYIDKKIFAALQETGRAELQLRTQAREEFLEQF